MGAIERKSTPSAAKGTLPLPGNVEVYIDSSDDHLKMIDENANVTDITGTAESGLGGDYYKAQLLVILVM